MKRSSHFADEPNMIKVALVETSDRPGGVQLVNAARIEKKQPNDLVELANEIQKADNFVYANACNKLQVIAQQVRFLQQQAQQILSEAKTNADLHHAACNFVKVPGMTYHLYERPTGQRYFSMLSPEEWNVPHRFLGSFRLEHDRSWTTMDQLKQRDNEIAMINKILSTTGSVNFMGALEGTPMDT